MRITEDQYLSILKTYINLLTNNIKEIFDTEVVSRFPQKREIIDKGIIEFGISEEDWIELQKADKKFIKYAETCLEWMQKEMTFAVREKYRNEIKIGQWYWWLDEIVEGKYSLKMIPEYLKDDVSRFYKK